MNRSSFVSTGSLALSQFCLAFLTPLAAEEAGSEVKASNRESKMPLELADAFEVPAGPKDAYGNPIRQGMDPQTGLPLEIRHKASGIHFVFIPAGEFMMGSPNEEDGRASDEKQHKVTLAKPFYMGKYEVTVGQFKAFVRAATYRTDAEKDGWAVAWTGSTRDQVNGASWQKPGFEQTEEHPVTEVSWNDCQAFIKHLNATVGAGLAPPSGPQAAQQAAPLRFSLPNEAQWEYACRAGTKGRFFWGEDETKAGQHANVADKTAKAEFSDWTISDTEDGYVFTAPVGRFKANAFGLYDMHGNVWEWCEDAYGDYDKALTNGTNDASRVLRGGCWGVIPLYCRSASRLWSLPDLRYDFIGLRLVLVVR
jgi:formylglycine-generating enzyme required for sulfatase activity